VVVCVSFGVCVIDSAQRGGGGGGGGEGGGRPKAVCGGMVVSPRTSLRRRKTRTRPARGDVASRSNTPSPAHTPATSRLGATRYDRVQSRHPLIHGVAPPWRPPHSTPHKQTVAPPPADPTRHLSVRHNTPRLGMSVTVVGVPTVVSGGGAGSNTGGGITVVVVVVVVAVVAAAAALPVHGGGTRRTAVAVALAEGGPAGCGSTRWRRTAHGARRWRRSGWRMAARRWWDQGS
jgi:hypothetical protein